MTYDETWDHTAARRLPLAAVAVVVALAALLASTYVFFRQTSSLSSGTVGA